MRYRVWEVGTDRDDAIVMHHESIVEAAERSAEVMFGERSFDWITVVVESEDGEQTEMVVHATPSVDFSAAFASEIV